jgi:hypothetical protein
MCITVCTYVYYITQVLGDMRKIENNLRVVGDMRAGVELGNKRVSGNRENSNAKNEEGIIQLSLRSKADRKVRRDAS